MSSSVAPLRSSSQAMMTLSAESTATAGQVCVALSEFRFALTSLVPRYPFTSRLYELAAGTLAKSYFTLSRSAVRRVTPRSKAAKVLSPTSAVNVEAPTTDRVVPSHVIAQRSLAVVSRTAPRAIASPDSAHGFRASRTAVCPFEPIEGHDPPPQTDPHVLGAVKVL